MFTATFDYFSRILQLPIRHCTIKLMDNNSAETFSTFLKIACFLFVQQKKVLKYAISNLFVKNSPFPLLFFFAWTQKYFLKSSKQMLFLKSLREKNQKKTIFLFFLQRPISFFLNCVNSFVKKSMSWYDLFRFAIKKNVLTIQDQTMFS